MIYSLRCIYIFLCLWDFIGRLLFLIFYTYIVQGVCSDEPSLHLAFDIEQIHLLLTFEPTIKLWSSHVKYHRFLQASATSYHYYFTTLFGVYSYLLVTSTDFMMHCYFIFLLWMFAYYKCAFHRIAYPEI